MRPLAKIAIALTLLALPLLAAEQTPQPDQNVIDGLNQTISWYRHIASHSTLATEPGDVLYLDDDLQLSRQVLSLEFDYARAEAVLIPSSQSGSTSSPAPLAKAAAAADDAVQKAQASVDANEKEVAAARTAKDRKIFEEQLAAAKSELSLEQTRAQTLKSLSDFVAQAGGTGGGVLGQIDELERSVPEIRATHAQQSGQAQPSAAAAAATAATAKKTAPGGVVELFSDLFSLGRKMREVRQASLLTQQLRARVDKVRNPLLADLKNTLAQAEQIAASPEPTDAKALADRKQRLDDSNSHFKKISAAIVPLAKEAVLLDAVRENLNQWHEAIEHQSDLEMRGMLIRLGLLLAALAVVFIASEFWRRATYRYVKDLKKRQQSLLVRRIVITAAVAITMIFSLVSELGSLATFAGFITAGLAVALQNVILSVAAYFFLIGKFGVRVGDRVQIGGVTGDVLDIGLVRMHVMELREGGLPTGRVVVFSNANVFGSSNFFKQLPGSEFGWHEVKLTLSGDTNYKLAEERLTAAVNKVFETYRATIEAQHNAMTMNLNIALQDARPRSRLRLTEGGLEMVIRYPVLLAQAASIDDQITRVLLDTVEESPELKLVGAGKPTIAAPEAPGA